MSKIDIMKKIISIISLGILVFSGIQCSSPKTAEETAMPEVSIKEEVSKGAFLVDVRTPAEFAAGSVEGAVNIPLDEVESRVNEFKGKPSVIVFCRSGNRSGQAKSILEANGVNNVTNGINVEHVLHEKIKKCFQIFESIFLNLIFYRKNFISDFYKTEYHILRIF